MTANTAGPPPESRSSRLLDVLDVLDRAKLAEVLQIGTSTLIGCETNPLGAVTTKLPQRGQSFPVAVSSA